MEPKLLAKVTNVGPALYGLGPLGQVAAGGQGAALENVISISIGLITLLAGIWFLLQMFLGAFNWISAGGDKSALEKAQKRITNAVIGLFMVVFAYGFTALVGKVLGLNILQVATVLTGLHP